MRSRAFTLLEVMVAVAILGLALTVILSAEAGLFAASSHAQNETMAIGMARCKMGEVEEELLRMGYPELDQVEEGNCCEDQEQAPKGMSCSWKIERIELPDPPSFAEDNPAGDDATLDMSSPGSSIPGGGSPFGAMMAAGSSDGGLAAVAGDGGLSGLNSMLGEAGGGGDIISMVMSMVYPTFKPLLEASIRKVTVTVKWKEGRNDRDLIVVQYVTNPMRGGFNLDLENVDPEAAAGGLGLTTGGSPITGGTSTSRPSITPKVTPR